MCLRVNWIWIRSRSSSLIHHYDVWCAWSWWTWAQTTAMALCLITNPGKFANTDLISQAKEPSYPWTNKQWIRSIWKTFIAAKLPVCISYPDSLALDYVVLATYLAESNWWGQIDMKAHGDKCKAQRYKYRVLLTIQMKLILLCIWAEQAIWAALKLL